MSNLIEFPLSRRHRPSDALHDISNDASITLIPTDAAYDSTLQQFKDTVCNLEYTPPEDTQAALGRIASSIALLSTHPAYSWEYLAARLCPTLQRSSDQIQREAGNFPPLVQLLGLAMNARSNHPSMTNLRKLAILCLSNSPGEYDLASGKRFD